MTENKTTLTDASVRGYLAARGSEEQRADCRELVIYLVPDSDEQTSLLSKLGPHKMGKSCLYFKRLADLDRSVLEKLVTGSVAKLRRRYGTSGG